MANVLEIPAVISDLDIRVRSWPDAYLDSAGHDPRSSYVETYWLGILGASATWLLRRIAAYLEAAPDGFAFDAQEWAGWLGTSCASGANSPFARTLRRCVDFGMARVPGGFPRATHWEDLPSSLEFRRKLPTLTVSQAQRLPPDLRHGHRLAIERGDVKPVITVMRERSRALALSLVRMGENLPAVERQLARWRFHPSLAAESAAWAFEQRDNP